MESQVRPAVKKTRDVQASPKQQLEQRTAELAILHSVGEAMASTLDAKTVTRTVGDKIRDIFHADIVSIMLVDAQTHLVHVRYGYAEGEGGYIGCVDPFAPGKELITKVIQSRQPLLLGSRKEQVESQADRPPGSGRAATPESLMVMPIIIDDKVRGVVTVGRLAKHSFDENSLRLLQTLSSSLGVAIENARLLDETQRRVEESTTLAKIGRDLSSTLDLSVVLERIAAHAMALFNARDVVLRLLGPDGRLPAVLAIA